MFVSILMLLQRAECTTAVINLKRLPKVLENLKTEKCIDLNIHTYIESQNILSWNESIKIVESNSWLHVGPPKNQTVCLKAIPKCFLNSSKLCVRALLFSTVMTVSEPRMCNRCKHYLYCAFKWLEAKWQESNTEDRLQDLLTSDSGNQLV